MEHVFGGRNSFSSEPAHEIGMDGAGLEHARTAGVNTVEVGCPRLMNSEKRIENRRHQQRAARMRRGDLGICGGIGLQALPNAFFIEDTDRLTQRAAAAGCTAELDREAPEYRLTRQIAAASRDLVFEDFPHR